MDERFGFDISQIGVPSWRKCAHTKFNCGSSTGPTIVVACIHGGHFHGANRNANIAYEKASDEYCERILVGLPEVGKDS